MDWFTPEVGILVQIGSGMLGMVIAIIIQERKENSFFENLSTLKMPVSIWLVCWMIGALDFAMRHI